MLASHEHAGDRMKGRLRAELWIAFIVFPAVLLLGRLFESFLSPETIAAAQHQQQALMSDLAAFTPVELVERIWGSIVTSVETLVNIRYSWEESDSVWQYLAQFLPLIYRLPIALVFAVWITVASIWDNETILASVLATISFILAIIIGIAVADQGRFGDKWGFWGFVPGVLVVFLAGTLICSLLWGLVWVGMTVFGWLTELAGYSLLGGGILSAGYVVVVQYAGFRAGRAAEGMLK
jgi:hypothetical protein